MGDLFDQGLVFAPARIGESAGHSVESLTDAMPTHTNVGDDKSRLEGCKVICRTVNGDGLVSAENAMAVADIAGADAGKLQRDHVFVQQAKQPTERTYKALRLVRPPVHCLGPGE